MISNVTIGRNTKDYFHAEKKKHAQQNIVLHVEIVCGFLQYAMSHTKRNV